MAQAETPVGTLPERLHAGGRDVECRLTRSRSARKLRIRVKPERIDVVLPLGRSEADAADFLLRNLGWVTRQIERAARIRSARLVPKRRAGAIPFRGAEIPVEIQSVLHWRAASRIAFDGKTVRIVTSQDNPARLGKTLEGWLRRQSKARIEELIIGIGERINRTPNQVYVMDQRTKWGNCSHLGNLSFSWRLIMAPDDVLRYMVTHEMVHLAIPDHSHRFWLTVQSLCPDSERARQWLVANADQLMQIDCVAICSETSPRSTIARDAA
jgi:predicted metal-dependent hydrolase